MHHHPALQPSPHDELVEPPETPPPDAAAVLGWLRALRDGDRPPEEAIAWAEATLARHLFPTPEEDDAGARLGEAVMQLSMLDRVPLTDHQLHTLCAFVAGQRSWSAWMAALR